MLDKMLYVLKKYLFIDPATFIFNAFWVWSSTIYEKEFVTFAKKMNIDQMEFPMALIAQTIFCWHYPSNKTCSSVGDYSFRVMDSLIYFINGFMFIVVAMHDLQQILVEFIQVRLAAQEKLVFSA